MQCFIDSFGRLRRARGQPRVRQSRSTCPSSTDDRKGVRGRRRRQQRRAVQLHAAAYEAKWDAAGSGDGEFTSPQGIATGTLDRFFVTRPRQRPDPALRRTDHSSVVRTSGTRLDLRGRTRRRERRRDLAVRLRLHGHRHRQHRSSAAAAAPWPPASRRASSDDAITSIRATTLDGHRLRRDQRDDPRCARRRQRSNDTLTGGGGNDTLTGGDGDDTLNGGGGSGDVVSYSRRRRRA